jgi:hypothetical protein
MSRYFLEKRTAAGYDDRVSPPPMLVCNGSKIGWKAWGRIQYESIRVPSSPDFASAKSFSDESDKCRLGI